MVAKLNDNLWVHTARGKAPQWIRDHATYAGDDCVAWPFCRDGRLGRGRIGQHIHGTSDQTKMHWAHRVMCEYVKGPPPTPKHQAAHDCGNGHQACMNPNHLDWKTNTQNQLDRTLHGTKREGRKPRNKLTPQQVAQIRAMRHQKTQYELAEMFGVKRGTIEYWLRSDRKPTPMSRRPWAVKRRVLARIAWADQTP